MLRWWFILLCLYEKETTAFHQNDYDVKLDIVEGIFYNESYITDAHIGRAWYNRSTRVISGNLTLIKNVDKKLRIDFQAYKFLSNEYRFFAITFSIDGCEERRNNGFSIKDTLDKCSNIGFCPLKKGRYYYVNCLVDFSQFPPYIPRGKYKLEAKLYNGDDYIAEFNIYGSIEDKKNRYY